MWDFFIKYKKRLPNTFWGPGAKFLAGALLPPPPPPNLAIVNYTRQLLSIKVPCFNMTFLLILSTRQYQYYGLIKTVTDLCMQLDYQMCLYDYKV